VAWKLRAQTREAAPIVLGAAALLVAVGGIAYQFVEPAPPRVATITTGGGQGAYFANAQKYAGRLAASGIKLDVKTSAGTLENLQRLSDPKSGVQIGFVQAGLADAATHPDLASLGRMFLEPLWVFHRTDVTINRLSDLAGLRIAPGPEGSGTRPFVLKVLQASGVTPQTAVMLGATSGQAATLLTDGQVDVVFFTMAAESELVQKLLRAPGIKLMSFTQADAYVRLFPYLSKIVLPAGVVDMRANIPPEDVTLISTAATLVVRKDLHPAIVGLLVDAAKEFHGMAGLFQKIGEFPQAIDSELPLDADAVRYFKNGPPFLQRYLPFWLATFLERMAILIIPFITILVPVVKFAPMLYQWRNKRRILHWYGTIKALERRVRADRSPMQLAQYRDEIAKIEDQVAGIRLPLMFSEQLYALRSAVDLVRQRITALSKTSGDRGDEVAAVPQPDGLFQPHN
jgi:TRAP transporter TAXI family solute receptor